MEAVKITGAPTVTVCGATATYSAMRVTALTYAAAAEVLLAAVGVSYDIARTRGRKDILLDLVGQRPLPCLNRRSLHVLRCLPSCVHQLRPELGDDVVLLLQLVSAELVKDALG